MKRWLLPVLAAFWLGCAALGCAAQHARAPQGLPARAIAERMRCRLLLRPARS